jgi:hypothetical protein
MKTQIIVLSLIFIYANCEDFILNKSNPIKGNGKITEKSIRLSDIKNVENTGIFNVFIKQGEKENARVEADENILSFLSYSIENNTISIFSNENFIFNPTKANIYITVKDIRSIENTGIGSINIDKFDSISNLKIENSGIGNVQLNGVKTSELFVENSGTGTIKLNGVSTKLKIENSGVGSINSFNMQSDYADIENSGVGTVEVAVSKEILISNDGVGSVLYKGSAIVKKNNESGLGSVKKISN